jgi:hypothetical protein
MLRNTKKPNKKTMGYNRISSTKDDGSGYSSSLTDNPGRSSYPMEDDPSFTIEEQKVIDARKEKLLRAFKTKRIR